MMIGADIVMKSLIREGVKTIFGYPGGVAIPLYDKMINYPEIEHVLTRHEQGASLAADGYARVTNTPGVCVSTSGPGATNLVTGIANAFLDSVPMVVITCQVGQNILGTDAFQEIDICGLSQSITKQTYSVTDPDDLSYVFHEAFFLANSGRKGPVLIDIPTDVLKKEATVFEHTHKISLPGYNIPQGLCDSDIKKFAKILSEAKKPLMVIGHGIILGNAEKEVKEFAEKLNIPVIHTLLGSGILDFDHDLNFHLVGMHGFAGANYATHNADFVLAFGCRFSDRVTGAPDKFSSQARIIHVDLDSAELNKNIQSDISFCGDAKIVLQQLIKNSSPQVHTEWIDEIREISREISTNKLIGNNKEVHPKDLLASEVITEISNISDDKTIISSDVGQNQMFVAQFFKFRNSHQLLSSGGLGTMGYSLPAAVGAAKACQKNQTVWAIMGDGGAQMNIQELGTIIQEKLPIRIVIINNSYLGMVRQWQELFYNKNYASTNLVNPDFQILAKSYGIPHFFANNLNDTKKILQESKSIKGPVLFEFKTACEENVFPMVSPGDSLKNIRLKK